MAKTKTTRSRAKDDIQSLYRKFNRLDDAWHTAKYAHQTAVSAARSQYPKPPSEDLERVLLLNQDLFDGEIGAPTAKHEAALIEICGRGNKEGSSFNESYQRLKCWRSWRENCRKIDRDHCLSDLSSCVTKARVARDEAEGKFIAAPVRSAEGIIVKFKYLLRIVGDPDSYRSKWLVRELMDGVKATGSISRAKTRSGERVAA